MFAFIALICLIMTATGHAVINSKRLIADMTGFLAKKHRLILNFSRDVANDNGLRFTREVTLQLQKVL